MAHVRDCHTLNFLRLHNYHQESDSSACISNSEMILQQEVAGMPQQHDLLQQQQQAPARNVTVFDMEPGELASCPGTYWFEVRI